MSAMHYSSSPYGKVIIGLILSFFLFSCQTVNQTVKTKSDFIHTIRVRHIADHEAYEDHKVRVGEEFYVADSEISVKIIRLVPDFIIDKKTKEVSSRTEQMLNPALELEVLFKNQLLYKTWVLYQNIMPHKVNKPGYYFQFLSYEETDR